MEESTKSNSMEMVVEIVSAYVANNSIDSSALPALIKSIHQTLTTLRKPSAKRVTTVEKATAAQIRNSITPDALISFENGKPYKMLKRHLSWVGLPFYEYKTKWGLPNDYPATAANYTEKRSEMAKSSGLGRKPGIKAKMTKG